MNMLRHFDALQKFLGTILSTTFWGRCQLRPSTN